MTVTRDRTPTAPPPTLLRPLGLLTLLLGAALPLIDFFVVNVALPTIERDLRASASTLEMVVAGYGVAYAVLLVLGGRLGDTFGRRRLFLWGTAGFGLTSLACGLAPDAWTLVAARVAQGATAALMLPQVLATIHATTQGPRRGRALALYGATGGVSSVLGQILGGVLVAADLWGSGWRSIFLINVPVAAGALLLAWRSVPDSRADRPGRSDLPGTLLLTATLVALLLPLTEGRAAGWPAWSWALLLCAPLAGWAFHRVERRAELHGGSPLLPPSLLREPVLRRGLALAVPMFVGFGGFMFVIAIALQQGLSMGPLASGITIAPMCAAFFTSSLYGPRVVAAVLGALGRRSDRREELTAGALVQGAGLVVLGLTVLGGWPDLDPWRLAPGMVVLGLGQGLQLPLYFRLMLSGVPAGRAGAGSGLAVTAQQSFLALGVALLGSLFLSLVPRLGARDALLTVLAAQLCGNLLMTLLASRLPARVEG
ncbi:MFS transporter [Streptomyces sp. NPDC005438]|uniref:MFS transporter n=1 Tax=Streptomyces sp. NPDC005438 TaxID=3156880 RepID=UPI0033B7FDAD